MNQNRLTRKLLIGVVALSLVGGVCGWYVLSDSGAASALADLDPSSFAQLRNEFNEAAGSVRVIALLSPT
jgi:hypothetical protein